MSSRLKEKEKKRKIREKEDYRQIILQQVLDNCKEDDDTSSVEQERESFFKDYDIKLLKELLLEQEQEPEPQQGGGGEVPELPAGLGLGHGFSRIGSGIQRQRRPAGTYGPWTARGGGSRNRVLRQPDHQGV